MAYVIAHLRSKRATCFICLIFPKNMYKEEVMEKKKLFVEPEVEVVRFDVKDVITASNLNPNGVYDPQSIKDFFNINIGT